MKETYNHLVDLDPTNEELDPFKDKVPRQPDIIEQICLDSLEDSFNHLDKTTVDTQQVRKAFLDKLVPIILDFDLRVGDGTDAEIYQAQAKMMDQARQFLNDMDSSAKSHTSLKLKQAALAEQQQANINVAEILSQVKLSNQAAWAAEDVNHPLKDEKELADTLRKLTEGEVITEHELAITSNKLPRKEEEGDEMGA